MKLRPAGIFQCEKDQVVGSDVAFGFGHNKPDKKFSGDRIPAFSKYLEGFLPILIRNTGEKSNNCFFAMGWWE